MKQFRVTQTGILGAGMIRQQSSNRTISPLGSNNTAATLISNSSDSVPRSVIPVIPVAASLALVAICVLPVLALRRGLRRWRPLTDDLCSAFPDPVTDGENPVTDDKETIIDPIRDENEEICSTTADKKSYRYSVPPSLSPIPDVESHDESTDSSSTSDESRTRGAEQVDTQQLKSVDSAIPQPNEILTTETSSLEPNSHDTGYEWNLQELRLPNDSQDTEMTWKVTSDDLSAVFQEVSVVPIALHADAPFLRSVMPWFEKQSKPIWKIGLSMLSTLGVPAIGPRSGSFDSASSIHSRTPMLPPPPPPCVVVTEIPFPSASSKAVGDAVSVVNEAGVPNKLKAHTLLGHRKWLKVENSEDYLHSSQDKHVVVEVVMD